MFGVVVNHFFKTGHPISVKQSTKFALSLLVGCPEVTSIILVDGSSDADPELQDYCESLGVVYQHSGRLLSFAEAYNYGVELLHEEWVVTMASDVYVYPNTFSIFSKFIEEHSDLPIGCLIPYLSSSDLPIQEIAKSAVLHDCYVPLMTFNLNVFPKAVLKKVGGLSTRYSGNFNDVDVTMKIRQLGLEVFLVAAYVQHYGRMTLQHGTNVDLQADRLKFFKDHPELESSNGLWLLQLNHLLRSRLVKIMYSASLRFVPRRYRNDVLNMVYRVTPYLQRI